MIDLLGPEVVPNWEGLGNTSNYLNSIKIRNPIFYFKGGFWWYRHRSNCLSKWKAPCETLLFLTFDKPRARLTRIRFGCQKVQITRKATPMTQLCTTDMHSNFMFPFQSSNMLPRTVSGNFNIFYRSHKIITSSWMSLTAFSRFSPCIIGRATNWVWVITTNCALFYWSLHMPSIR